MNTRLENTDTVIFRDIKILVYLILAAISITFTGLIQTLPFRIEELVAKAIITIALVGLVYSFNDIIDNSKQKIQAIYIIQPLLWGTLLILSFMGLRLFSQNIMMNIYIGLSILFIGIIYSVEIPYKDKIIKIKKVFILKNIFIGLGWALLVFLGNSNDLTGQIITLAIFCFLQVFIGSVIRDMGDTNSDQKEKVNSLPVKFGINKTIAILHTINLISIIQVFFFYSLLRNQVYLALELMIPVLWRAILLMKIKRNNNDPFLLQSLNLGTCLIILLSQVVFL